MSNNPDSANGGAIVTPSDTNKVLRGHHDFLYVWVAGNLAFVTLDGNTIGPYAVTAGQFIPYRVAKVLSSTTAVVSSGYY